MSLRPKVLAITSDHHVNSRLGLCPPEGAKLGVDGEGSYHPSKAQLWLWDRWEEYWRAVRDMVRETRGQLICIYNGDTQDGPGHHGNVQQIAGDEETQAFLATRVFSVPRALKPYKQYMVVGTEVHSGPGHSADSSLARHLGCDRDAVTDSWATFWLRLKIDGIRLDLRHHGRTGSRPWTVGGIANLAAEIALEHANAGQPIPHLAIRSHKHRHADSGSLVPACRAIVTPAWCLKTSFGHKVAAESLADIGGIVVVIKGGRYEVIDLLYAPDLPEERTP